MSRIETAQGRVSAWIMRRPNRAWVVTLVALFLMTASVPPGATDGVDRQAAWKSVMVLFWMVVLAGFPLLVPRLTARPYPQVVALLCLLCLAPTMLALWAAARGASGWLPIAGWALSTFSVDMVIRRAVRAARTPRTDPPPN